MLVEHRVVWSFLGGASCSCSVAAALHRAAEVAQDFGTRCKKRPGGKRTAGESAALTLRGNALPLPAGRKNLIAAGRELALPKTGDCWKSADLLIQKLPFQENGEGDRPGFQSSRFQSAATGAPREASEGDLAGLYEDPNLCASCQESPPPRAPSWLTRCKKRT
uniref:putative histone H3.3-like type 3 n=1 Tax=Halichoerus grypus TaxID=9711 RepID=UPI0016599B74|nr:putative histone H3.3-like type 3 [Halichoerus grypus]